MTHLTFMFVHICAYLCTLACVQICTDMHKSVSVQPVQFCTAHILCSTFICASVHICEGSSSRVICAFLWNPVHMSLFTCPCAFLYTLCMTVSQSCTNLYKSYSVSLCKYVRFCADMHASVQLVGLVHICAVCRSCTSLYE